MRDLKALCAAAVLALCLCLSACGARAPAAPEAPPAPAPEQTETPAAPAPPAPALTQPETPAVQPTPAQPAESEAPAAPAEPEPTPAPAVPVLPETPTPAAPKPAPPASEPQPEPAVPEAQPEPEPPAPEEEATLLYITFNGHTYTAVPAQNSSAEAFVELLRRSGGSVTVAAHDYGGFEKVGPLPESLPRNDEPIDTTAGDLILYQGSNICLYYSTNSWTFTRLARLEGDLSSLKADLGSGDVSVTYSIGT